MFEIGFKKLKIKLYTLDMGQTGFENGNKNKYKLTHLAIDLLDHFKVFFLNLTLFFTWKNQQSDVLTRYKILSLVEVDIFPKTKNLCSYEI